MEGNALQTAIAQARAEGNRLLDALEAFRQDFGRYPTGSEGLMILMRNPDPTVYTTWHGPYGGVNDDLIVDPWGRRYDYETTDREIAVISAGRDRRPNTGDEVREARTVNYYGSGVTR